MPWVKSKKPKRRINKKAIKLYLVIIFICFLVAWGLAFVTGKLPTMTRQIEEDIIEEVARKTGKKIDSTSLKELKETFSEKIEKGELEKLKESYKEYKKKKEGP